MLRAAAATFVTREMTLLTNVGDPQRKSTPVEQQVQDDIDDKDDDASLPAPAPVPPSRTQDHAMRRASLSAAPYDISYRPSVLLLYSRPQQRQKWGDTQVLPRVDHGDLFFDLFYVGATYNISTILNATPTGRGLLYAMATFFAVMSIWNEKLVYDCRFVIQGDDVWHRIMQLSLLLVLAVAVLNIRPIDVLVGQKRSFIFCLALVLERLLNLTRYLEVYIVGVGQKRQLQHCAVSAMRNSLFSLSFYMAATVVAWNASQLASSHRWLAESAVNTSPESSSTESNHAMDDLPIILVLCGFLGQHFAQNMQIVFFFPKDGLHKELTIPVNVGFIAHRNGEWIMLMLGESIFSILIVYVSDQSSIFYTTFYCGLLLVVLLQYLHFLSLPRDSVNHHALRRNKDAGVLWLNLHMIYSFALVALGSTFTTFLLDETSQNNVNESRFLAEAGTVGDSDTIRRQNAHLFAGSLAVIFFCLDTMILAHMGLGEGKDRCVCHESKRINLSGMLLVVFRVGLLAFTATLGIWVVEPASLAITGLVCVVVQLLFRRLGLKYLSHAYEDPDGGSEGSARWPNITVPQVERHHR